MAISLSCYRKEEGFHLQHHANLLVCLLPYQSKEMIFIKYVTIPRFNFIDIGLIGRTKANDEGFNSFDI